MTSMFEERLREELMTIAAERLETPGPVDVIRPSAVRRYRAPLTVGAVAAAAAGLVAFPVLGDASDNGSAAYAVSRSSDGTVTVRLFNTDGLPGLERDLRSRGVRVRLMGRTPSSECRELHPKSQETADRERALLAYEEKTPMLRINDRTLPPGWTLLLIKPGIQEGQGGVGFEEVEQLPDCIPDFSVGAPRLMFPQVSPSRSR